MDTSLEFARMLDAEDELASLRQDFVIEDDNLIYMDGNSLGRLPQATAGYLREIIEKQWGEGLIRGWGGGWYDTPVQLGDKIGLLLGAAPGQVLVSDSTTVNLFKLYLAALSDRPERTKIVSDVLNFPTDLYTLEGCIRLLGQRHRLELIPSADGIEVDLQQVWEAIDTHTALVTFSIPTFKSGFLYDVEAITRRAHQVGAYVLWDLCHGVSVVPLELDRWGVDFAVGCTYKYLNGGPGAPAFLYVRRELQERLQSPIWGWWGHAASFAFDLDYQPAQGIRRFLAGTPPILSMKAIEPAVDQLLAVGVERLRAKSIRLSSYLVGLFDTVLAPLDFTLGSPRDPAKRGSHISIRHAEGYRINRALIEEMKVIPDFREPDNIRLGLAPLYTTFSDVWQAVDRIRQVMMEKRYLHYSLERSKVS